jgi:hypothetical protein
MTRASSAGCRWVQGIAIAVLAVLLHGQVVRAQEASAEPPGLDSAAIGALVARMGVSVISCVGHADGKEGTHAWHDVRHR